MSSSPSVLLPQKLESLLLDENSPELQDVLEHGRHRSGGRELIARPSLVRDEPDKGRVVCFELIDPATIARPAAAKLWLQAIRAISLTATLTPCIAILLYGRLQGFELHLPTAMASMLGVLLLQIGVNLMNDVEDYRRLIDLPGTLGGAGVIQQGWLSARQVRRVAWASMILGLGLGIPALLREPSIMLMIAAIVLLGGIGYSWRPLGLKYKALGDLAVLLLCGPALSVGFSLAAFGVFDRGILLLGTTFGLAAVGILHCNNFQDIAIDRSRGAVTVASLVGERASRAYLLLLYLLAFASWALAWIFVVPRMPLPALIVPGLAIFPTFRLIRSVLLAPSMQVPELALIRIHAAQLHLLIGLGLCAGLGISLFL